MKKTLGSSVAFAAAWMVVPTAAAAHSGHAGDHGWLFGALQPLLAVDHFLSALIVVAMGGTALAVLGASRRVIGKGSRPR